VHGEREEGTYGTQRVRAGSGSPGSMREGTDLLAAVVYWGRFSEVEQRPIDSRSVSRESSGVRYLRRIPRSGAASYATYHDTSRDEVLSAREYASA